MDNKHDSPKIVKKKVLPRVIITVVALIAILVIGKKVLYALNHEQTDNAQVDMRLIPILCRVSGYIEKIYVDDYAKVKKGQLLVVIDSTDLELNMEEMKADYAQSLSDVENAKASIANAEASLSFSKGNVDVIALRKEKATIDFSRDKKLYEASAITAKQFEDSHSNFGINMKQLEMGHSDIKVSETRLNMLRSQLTKALAAVQLKKSRIEQQSLKISYCRIFAVADGKIGKRNADDGQFVQAGTPLFTTVNDENIWVIANFKENQIKNIRCGQQVDLKLDGFPALPLKGKVLSFSEATGARFSLLPPDDATGNFVKVTQRIPVRIEIINVQEYKDIFRAGMSIEVSVPIL